MTSTLTTTLRRLALVGALGAGLFGIAAPAGADPFPAGPGDITAPQADPTDPGDGNGGGTDPGPEVDGSDELPPAPVGDVVVANPTFTG